MVNLTKNELKKQKDNLKRFQRYLPTLKLKQQQLQTMLQRVQMQIQALRDDYNTFFRSIQSWIAVFGDEYARNINSLIEHAEIITATHNIAGVDVPVFEDFKVSLVEYSVVDTPYWVDAGLDALISVLKILSEIKILAEQYALLEQELRITIQRVNLFEKVKIPETKHNIRAIQIYLGDQQTASVVRGKITKSRTVESIA